MNFLTVFLLANTLLSYYILHLLIISSYKIELGQTYTSYGLKCPGKIMAYLILQRVTVGFYPDEMQTQVTWYIKNQMIADTQA